MSADFVDFGRGPEELKAEYLDVYEGVCAKVVSMDGFGEDTDLGATYLGQVDMAGNVEVGVEEDFPIAAWG